MEALQPGQLACLVDVLVLKLRTSWRVTRCRRYVLLSGIHGMSRTCRLLVEAAMPVCTVHALGPGDTAVLLRDPVITSKLINSTIRWRPDYLAILNYTNTPRTNSTDHPKTTVHFSPVIKENAKSGPN